MSLNDMIVHFTLTTYMRLEHDLEYLSLEGKLVYLRTYSFNCSLIFLNRLHSPTCILTKGVLLSRNRLLPRAAPMLFNFAVSTEGNPLVWRSHIAGSVSDIMLMAN